MRRHPDMRTTRDEWTAGEWIVGVAMVAFLTFAIILLAHFVGSVLHIRWP